MLRQATLSKDGVYRYTLTRAWEPAGSTVMFIGLNPSIADDQTDDPTVRRCIGFAKKWGAGRLLLVNLFALRSPNPAALRHATDPVGPENDAWIDRCVCQADRVVAAWGSGGRLHARGAQIASRYLGLVCLGRTQRGHPRHPLYVPGHAEARPMPELRDTPTSCASATAT